MWFGAKAHVQRRSTVNLEADLEMHVSRGGYLGVNRIGDGEVNVCGLLRFPNKRPAFESKTDWLRGETGSLLNQRLGTVEFDEASFCSVGGLNLKPRKATDQSECCIGDTLTMTPPVTGNGMSMAFESAEIAMDPLAQFSEGLMGWDGARGQIAQRCDATFTGRLTWARLLQWMMTARVLQGSLGGLFLRSDWLWAQLFARTR